MESRPAWNNWRNASILGAACMGLLFAASRSDRLWAAFENAVGAVFLGALGLLAVAAAASILGFAGLVIDALAGRR